VAAAGCAILLHLAPDRSAAARLVPLAVVWGVAACRGAPRLTEARPTALFAAALAVRLPLVGTPLHLSDDLYRYLWEGQALAAGIDVFTRPPGSVAGLDDALRDLVNHADIPSIYPPLALAWFRVLALAGTVPAVQALTAVVDATVPLSILAATRRPGLAWVYVLHPLAALEAASGGHVDAVAVALAAAGVALWRNRRSDLAFASMVAGALVKLFPALLIPALLRGVVARRAAAWALGGAVASGLALAAVWPEAVPPAIGAYTGRWAFNGLVHPWLEPWLGPLARPALVAAAAVATAAAWVRIRDPAALWWALGAVFLATSPTVHPWYALWFLVPGLLAGRLSAAWAVVPLLGSYTVLWAFDPRTGAWSEAWWLWWITWPPALGLFVAQVRSEAAATEPYPAANSARNGSDAQ
jgi:hypothetical protein